MPLPIRYLFLPTRLLTCSVSAAWKLAEICPIFKKDDPLDKFNHRPVSILVTLDHKFKLALFIHKIKNDSANIPTIFSGSLTLASEVHSYNTRFATNFNIYRPNINNNYGATTFFCF